MDRVVASLDAMVEPITLLVLNVAGAVYVVSSVAYLFETRARRAQLTSEQRAALDDVVGYTLPVPLLVFLFFAGICALLVPREFGMQVFALDAVVFAWLLRMLSLRMNQQAMRAGVPLWFVTPSRTRRVQAIPGMLVVICLVIMAIDLVLHRPRDRSTDGHASAAFEMLQRRGS